MRKLQFIIAAFILLFTLQSNAQVSVSLNINSPRPTWYNHHESECDYYYLPEIEAYYDVRSSVYIYLGPRGWIRSLYLPEYCHNYDVNNGYRVAIDYRGHSPYAYFNNHRDRYYRSNYRNYREEYYRPNYENRRVYVSNHHRDDDDDDDHKHYKGREKQNKGRGHGNGHGNGRR
ncbi:hypothetical protein [Flavobacterium sp.]|uniref:hypothetical protein n=1 Tax=Flavobacterium sp. TaxID=239 RepID=UPI0037520F48